MTEEPTIPHGDASSIPISHRRPVSHDFNQPRTCVHVDCEITRRKRFHLVMQGDGDPVFRSAFFGDVLEWLDDNDISRYDLCRAGHAVHIVHAHQGNVEGLD